MWYVVQAPAGRETEAADQLNRIYADKAEKPCFVLSKERTWRMGGVYYVDTEVMFPGYLFADVEDAAYLEQGVRRLSGILKLTGPVSAEHPSGTAEALGKEEELFLKELLRADPYHIVRRFLVRANDAGEIEWAEGILGRMLPQIVRKRLRKRVVVLSFKLLGEIRTAELAIRMEGDRTETFHKKSTGAEIQWQKTGS